MTAATATPERARFNRRAIAPALVILFVAAGLPAIFLLTTSLTPFQLVRPGSETDFSAPFDNYRLLAADPRFVNSIFVQMQLSFWSVLLQVVLGTLLALFLNTKSRAVAVMRPFFLVPMVLPPIVVAVIWKLLYTPDISPIYDAASLAHIDLPAFTSSVDFALPAIIVADSWEWLPFVFLMVFAALQTIPDEYMEAALIDGAGRFQIFIHITLPSIAPVLIVSALFRLIDSIKAFPLIFLLTSGGPGSITEVTNFYAYLLAFSFGQIGYASGVTVTLVALIAIASLIIMRLSARQDAVA